jgi:hypothetical protein
LAWQPLRDTCAQIHKPAKRGGRQLYHLLIPTAHLIEKFMHAGDACGYLRLLFRTRLRGKPAQRGDGWINLAHHALLDDGEKELPHILRRGKKIPAVAHMMRRPHQLPVLKLSEASAHVGARYREGFRDVLSGQRIHRKVQQCMNLRHSTVQAPSAAHFAPVKDELACHSRESHKRSFVYCYFGIYRNLQKKQRGW